MLNFIMSQIEFSKKKKKKQTHTYIKCINLHTVFVIAIVLAAIIVCTNSNEMRKKRTTNK